MSDRCQKFLNRVDAELPSLAPIEQRKFLTLLILGWEEKYQRFIESNGNAEHCADPNNPIDASDFLLTIAGLSKRLSNIVKAAS